MAIIEACKETIWLRGLFDEICVNLYTTSIFCDSQNTIFLTKYQMFHERTKHIDVLYHFVREVIVRSDIVVSKVSTHDYLTDMINNTLPHLPTCLSRQACTFCFSSCLIYIYITYPHACRDKRARFASPHALYIYIYIYIYICYVLGFSVCKVMFREAEIIVISFHHLLIPYLI